MHFNTSALIAILRSDAPSVDAFQACLDEANILNFSPLDETESDQLHQMLGAPTPMPAAALFFAVLFSKVAQNTASAVPTQLLIATLNKLHTLNDPNLLIYLVNTINLVEALPTTLDIELPGLPKLKITNPTVENLKLNLLKLIKTMRVNETQVQHALDFCHGNTQCTLGFDRFLTQTAFNWEEDETALLALLPNDEGLFTALGFLHGLHYTVQQTIAPEKLESHMFHYTIEKKPAPPMVTRNVNITTLALKKNLPHPVPFMLATDEKTATISEHLVIAVFLNPELTHEHLRMLAEALRPYNIKLIEYTFNQRLLNAASKTSIVTDEKKPRVLTDHLGWDPNQEYRVKTSKDGVMADLGDFMRQFIQRQDLAITTLSVLLTLPHITLNRYLVTECTKAINIDMIAHATKHLLSNPSLNAPNATELKREAIGQMVAIFYQHIEAATQHPHYNKQPALIGVICNLLLTLQNDDTALFRIIELINAQKNAADAQRLFNDIIKHRDLTDEQRDELNARTNDRRRREDEDPTLVLWPEPITNALLQQPSVRTLQTAIQRELGNPFDSTAPAFQFAEAFPYLPQNQETAFQYDQLPLALLKDETLQGGLILETNNIFSLPLSLLIFRNRQFNPTHYALCRYDQPNTTLSLNIFIFALLGHADAIFNLPADDSHCLDNYVDTFIRLMINTKPLSHWYSALHTGDLVYLLANNFQSTRNTIITLLELTGIEHAVHPGGQLVVSDYHLEERLSLTLKKYLALPAVRSALYQKDILDEGCLMKSMPSEKNRSPDELRGTPVTEATLSTLSSRLAIPNTCDFRSAMLFMAFSNEAIDSPRLNKIIRQHLLGKTLTTAESSTLISALKLLDHETFTALKEAIVAWFSSHDERRKIAKQLINNHSSETNPLLLTLMIRQREYAVKETAHYKKLKSLLSGHENSQEDQPEQELHVIKRMPEPAEEATPLNDIKEKSRAFIVAAFSGEITWSNTAPFLPLPGQAHLPLEEFSLAGISPEELWSPLLKSNHIASQFLLFLLRHQETRWLIKAESRTQPILPRYLVAFALLGKNKAIFNLEADEARHLMSYQDALIKHAIDSRTSPHAIQFQSEHSYSFWRKSTPLDTAIKANPITSYTFNNVTYEAVIGFYLDCVKGNPAVAMALRQNELLNHPNLLMPVPPYNASRGKIKAIQKCIKAYGPTDATLQQLHENIFSTDIKLELRIQYLVIYIAFSSETDSIKAFIQSWLIKPTRELCHNVYSNSEMALEKLSPAQIKHLKSQINGYCAKQKTNPFGEEIKTALDTNKNITSPFLLLLKIGQTSGQIKPTGNHLGKLTLFYQDKPISEKDAVKYGLAPKPGPQ